MRPMAAAAVGALIAGVAMYAVGTRAQQSPFAEVPALVQTVDGQYVRVPNAQPVGYVNGLSGLQPIGTTGVQTLGGAPVVERVALPQRTVYRTAAPSRARVVE